MAINKVNKILFMDCVDHMHVVVTRRSKKNFKHMQTRSYDVSKKTYKRLIPLLKPMATESQRFPMYHVFYFEKWVW